MAIHPTAIIAEGARIAPDVEIGAYSIIGANVSIDSGTWVGPHVVIEGHTSIGKNAGEPTRLEIGDNNTIREFCTFNIGTAQDVGVTRMGNNNWIMAYVHLGHDCLVGNNTIFANNATLGGHVHIGDWVILGGFTSVHQFCHIGDHAMTAFSSAVAQDVPPYVMAHGNRAVPSGINAEGLKRRGFTPEQIRNIRNAYKSLYRKGLSFDEAKAEIIAAAAANSELDLFVRFFETANRGIIR